MSAAAAPLAEAEARCRAGQYAAALALIEQLPIELQAQPRALIVRANAANGLGDLDVLIDALRALADSHGQPGFTSRLATALNNRALARRRAGELAAAQQDLADALRWQPEHPQAWFNLATLHHEQGQRSAAIDALRQHLQVVPDDLAARAQLAASDADSARALLDALPPAALAGLDRGHLARLAAAAGAIDQALDALLDRSAPADPLAAQEAIDRLLQQNAWPAAERAAGALQHRLREAGRCSLRSELASALALPAIYRDGDDVQRWRHRFGEQLARLDADWTEASLRRQPIRLADLVHCNFLLAYQGEDDRELQRRFAGLIERAARLCCPPAAASPAPVRRRVGLLSGNWRDCTVGRYFGGWLRWARAAGCEVLLYQLGPRRDAYTDRLAADADHFRFLNGPLEAAAQIVRDDRLDLLIYPDVGMDARITPLAALRLARHQAAGWGHPVTTGFSQIDSFLSCAAMEPPDGAAHYTERLVTLAGLGVDYRRDADAQPAIERADEPPRPQVLVPQSLFKLHPDGDAVLTRIAAGCPAVEFVLFEAEHPEWQPRFQARLQRAFAAESLDAARHLRFLPLCSRQRYLQINRSCQLMLDSLHWSGGNTALDALVSGLPLVACPGRFMRGRQSAAMLASLGLDAALVCATPQQQADRAIELLGDAPQRRALAAGTQRGLDRLFDPGAAQRSFTDWLQYILDLA